MTRQDSPPPKPQRPAGQSRKADARADALRANLQKRKQQARARTQSDNKENN